MGFPAQGFRSGLTYAPDRDDVFVATYPKCGTTWTQYIVYLLQNDVRGLEAGQKLEDVFPHLEEVGREAVRALGLPRLIKTHLPRALVPFGKRAKYIYVIRNPFDCAVSFFHHTRGFVKHYDFAAGDFDTFFENFVTGRVDFGDYFDHLLGWYAERGRANVLCLSYESMRADTREAIRVLGKFLGGPAARLVEDADAVARIEYEASFTSMRRDQRRWSSARPAGMPEFVRKGVVGDWRATFSAEQARRLAERFAERTAGSDAASLWSDIVALARNC